MPYQTVDRADRIAGAETPQRVTIQGVAVRKHECAATTPRGSCEVSVYHVIASEGTFTVRFRGNRPHYGGSNVEGFADTPLTDGDTIQVCVRRGPDDVWSANRRRPRLIALSDRRREDYEQQRSYVYDQLLDLRRVVADKDYPRARNYCAALRKQSLTADEQAEMRAHARCMPRREQPVWAYRPAQAAVLERAYKCNIETMGQNTFLRFAEGVMSGREIPSSDSSPLACGLAIIGLLRDRRFDDDERFTVYGQAVAIRQHNLRQNYVDVAIVTRCVDELAKLSSVKACEQLMLLVEHCINNSLFEQRGGYDSNNESMLAKTLRGLRHSFARNCDFGLQGTEIIGLWGERLEELRADTHIISLVRMLTPFHPCTTS